MLCLMMFVAAVINVAAIFVSSETLAFISCTCTHFAWRLLLVLSPWVRISQDTGTAKGLASLVDAIKYFQENRNRPVFVLANHTSFFDTVLIVTQFPMIGVGIVRTYINAALLKKPLLSSVCWGCQHFPVYFKSTEDGKFSLDKEKFAIVDSRVNNHIEKKGLLAFFPEGQINSNPERLLQFRYGGMKKALQYDASLFFFVNTGNHSVWPRKAAIGGFPGSVKYRVECIAKDGCSKLVSQLKENKLLLQKHGCDVKSPDHEILAKYLRSAMQDTLDSMNSADQKKEA